jgi:DNA-binding XRE family transcriptional regulator
VDKCNINVRTIQRIEAGEVNPRSYTIRNILEALGTSIDEVFHDDKNMEDAAAVKAVSLKSSYLITGGITGIVYMVLYTIQVTASLSYSMNNTKLFENLSYTIISMGSFIFLSLFYGAAMYLGKHKVNKFFVFSTLAFIFICFITTFLDIYYYNYELYDSSVNSIIMISTSSFVYGLGYVFMGIALFIQRKSIGNLAKWAGISGIVGGIGFATIILFPAGIIGTLIFEVLLIVFLFMEAGHKKSL